MNLPNKLTVLRVLLIPLFIALVSLPFIPGSMLWAALIFALASLTDYFDGHIARKRDLVTDFGKFMDPLADKILTTTAIVYMLVDGVCDPIALLVILAREFAVAGVRMVAAADGGKVIAASFFGKVKTVLQMVTILAYYITAGLQQTGGAFVNSYIPQTATYILMWIVAVVTLLSGIQYIWQNRSFVNTTK